MAVVQLGALGRGAAVWGKALGGLQGKEQLMALLTELSGPALQIFSGILLILKPE